MSSTAKKKSKSKSKKPKSKDTKATKAEKKDKKKAKKAAAKIAAELEASSLANGIQLDDQNGMYNGSVVVRDSDDDWASFQKRIAKSKADEKWSKLMGRPDSSPLKWMLDSSFDNAIQARFDSTQIAGLIGKVLEGDLLRGEALTALSSVNDGPVLIQNTTADQFEQLLSAVARMDQNDVWFSNSDAWLFQLVRVELPLALSFQFPKEKSLVQSAHSATLEMAGQIRELLDGDGMPAANNANEFGRLIASWARCWAMLGKLEPELDPEVEEQLEWTVRQLLRMLRPDGSLMFSDTATVDRSFAKLLLKMSGDKDDAKIATRCLPKPPNKKNASAKSDLGIDESDGSDWGEIAVMQTRWERGAPKCGVVYNGRNCVLDICGTIGLIAGGCAPRISLNGKLLSPVDEFELTCWQSDDDADYLEIEMELEHGVTLQRQIMLARNEEFLYVADVIVPEEPGLLEYECAFPLSDGVKVMEESETRELYLKDKKIRSLVLPLALPEWKVARTSDSLTHEDGNVVLRQSQTGRGMFAGLLFDLNARRSVRPRTWRQLTVAETLESVPHDVAVAFRVNIGMHQWVFYRVVSKSGNRTFLGENFNEDFFAGGFQSDGSVEGIMVIE